MYNLSNLSTSSTGSYSKRLSSNNPFRPALLQEEARLTSVGSNDQDAQYQRWLRQQSKIEEEESDSYSSENSFSEDDENRNKQAVSKMKAPVRPRLYSTNSDSSLMQNRKTSYNPFAGYVSPNHTGASNTTRAPAVNRQNKPSSIPLANDNYFDDHDLPPPYEEVAGKKYGKNEYPSDEKPPLDDSDDSLSFEDDSNPFPTPAANKNSSGSNRTRSPPVNVPTSQVPRVRSSQKSPTQRSHKLSPEALTSQTHTRIMSDGRVRSKSTGEVSSPPPASRSKKPLPSTSNAAIARAHSQRHRHHHHSSKDDDSRTDKEREHRHRSSSGRHRSSRKKTVLEKPKNLDTIDKLDVTGFFSGGGFHHDGPFDACTPHRNKNSKAAPVMAYAVDGPNNSIKGVAPVNNKEQQFDMVFGISEEDPLYTTKVQDQQTQRQRQNSGPHQPPQQQQQQQQPRQQQQSPTKRTASTNSTTTPKPATLAPQRKHSSSAAQARKDGGLSRSKSIGSPQFQNGVSPYSNGVIVKKASRSSTTLLNQELRPVPGVVAFDANTKGPPVHGDTTLGLGSSTFLDGAPAYGDPGVNLDRKKSVSNGGNGLLRRVKSLKVGRR